MSPGGLSPPEEAVAGAALDAGFLTRAQLDAARAACDAQRRAGQPASLLPFLTPLLQPDQLAHLRGVYERALDVPTTPEVPDLSLPPQLPQGPTRIGRYRVVRELGRGGMGAVYLAEEPELDRQVALKVVLPGADASTLERLRIEARAASRLEHPGIVRLHTAERDARGLLLMSLELVRGGSLSERLKAEGPLPPREAAALVAEVARAVQYAHDQGVLHRDLKPANIMLTPEGRPKVSDFGLAKHQDDAHGLTASGTILGSPGYMSPEQAAGELERVDVRADVYGLGATLFALLTGRPPFTGALVNVLKKLLTEDAPAPSSLNPDVDPALDAICLAALSSEPEDRTPSAAALADALDDYLADPAPSAPAARARLVPGLLLLAASLTALLGALMWRGGRGGGAPAPPSPGDPTPVSKAGALDPAPATATPTPELTERLVLDADTLRSAELPGLRVWGLRTLRLDADGLAIRCSTAGTAELTLPVQHAGEAFQLELEATLRMLEMNGRLSVGLHAWPPANRSAMPELEVRLGSVGREAEGSIFDTLWTVSLLGRGQPLTAVTRAERSPDARVRAVLSYSPAPPRARLRVVGPRDGVWFEQEAELRAPLPRGPCLLRFGAILRDSSAYASGNVFRPPTHPRYNAGTTIDIRGLRLRVRAASATELRPDPPSGSPGPGRLARAILGGHDRVAIRRGLEALFKTRSAPIALLLAARHHERLGQLEPAVEAYTKLEALLREEGPRIGNRFHVAWSDTLINASPETLTALRRSYPSWGLTKDPSARSRALINPKGKGRLTDVQLLLSGTDLEPTGAWRARAKDMQGYLRQFRAAETALLLNERPTPARSHEALAWLSLGNLDRAEPFLRRWLRTDPDGAALALAVRAFRHARWRACLDWWERIAPGRRSAYWKCLLPTARRNAIVSRGLKGR